MMSPRRLSIAAICCVATSLVIAVVTATRITGPSIRPDEWGYLLNGQVLIGNEEPRLPFTSMYPAGFGFLTGAWAWMGGSLRAAFRLTLFTNVALMAVLGYLAFRFTVTTLKAGRTTGYLVTALVIASPGTLAGSLFAVPETLTKVLFLLLAILLGSMVTQPRLGVVVLFGALSGLAPIFSSRLVAITVSAVLLLIALAWKVIVARSAAMLGACALVVGYVLTRIMNSIVRDVLYYGRRSGESRIVNRALSVDLWPDVARVIVGQIWYLSAATACLGLVALTMIARSVLNSAGPGERDARRSSEIFPFVFILVTFIFLLVLGALQLAQGKRADHYIYGRYIETCIPPLFAIACVMLERTRSFTERVWRSAIVLFALLTLLYVVITRADVVWRAISINGPMRTANVLAIDTLIQAVPRPGLVTMTLVLCAVSISVVMMHMRRDQLALVALASLLLVSSGWTATTTLINRSAPDKNAGIALREVGQSSVSRIAFDGLKPQDRNYFTLRYVAHPTLIVWLDTTNEVRVPESFSCLYGYEDRRPVDGDWEIVGRETSIERVLWRRAARSSC